jgi:L-amino acid N-acyltransferase YncA
MKSYALMIRDADESDMGAIQRIYAFYVLQSLATFEEVPPTIDDLLSRRKLIIDAALPYLVAAIDGQVVGYAYAGLYRSRPAYRHTVEDSVYVADGSRSKGIGTALLTAVIERCKAGGWRQMIAVIGDTENVDSIALHRRCGFQMVGTLTAVGFKFNKWVDTVLMQRSLG